MTLTDNRRAPPRSTPPPGVMCATRCHHLGPALHLPDASVALFFLGGFYVRQRWSSGLLLAAAVMYSVVSAPGTGADAATRSGESRQTSGTATGSTWRS